MCWHTHTHPPIVNTLTSHSRMHAQHTAVSQHNVNEVSSGEAMKHAGHVSSQMQETISLNANNLSRFVVCRERSREGKKRKRERAWSEKRRERKARSACAHSRLFRVCQQLMWNEEFRNILRKFVDILHNILVRITKVATDCIYNVAVFSCTWRDILLAYNN